MPARDELHVDVLSMRLPHGLVGQLGLVAIDDAHQFLAVEFVLAILDMREVSAAEVFDGLHDPGGQVSVLRIVLNFIDDHR